MYIDLRSLIAQLKSAFASNKERQGKTRQGEEGQGLVEYALIILFVIIPLVIIVKGIAPPLITMLTDATNMF